jgi:hypothetical protein
LLKFFLLAAFLLVINVFRGEDQDENPDRGCGDWSVILWISYWMEG